MESFIAGYIQTALWATTDESDDSGGAPLDDTFDPDDLDETTRAAMEADCRAFYEEHAHLWEDEEHYDDDQAGGDFWLTRHRHGAGFWDRGLEHGEELTKAAHAYGDFPLFADFEAGKVRS